MPEPELNRQVQERPTWPCSHGQEVAISWPLQSACAQGPPDPQKAQWSSSQVPTCGVQHAVPPGPQAFKGFEQVILKGIFITDMVLSWHQMQWADHVRFQAHRQWRCCLVGESHHLQPTSHQSRG